jgi:5'-nucleotidase
MVDELPDLVLSGVNRGQNTADEVTYSGTIAGAIEGTILGIPSIALSLASDSLGNSCKLYWETPLALGSKVVKNLLETGWPEGVFLNINFPACPPESVGNVVITRQGQRNQALIHIEDRMDTRGDPYYWLGYERSKIPPPAGTDLDAIGSGNISVTPLSLDLTDNAALHLLRSRSS